MFWPFLNLCSDTEVRQLHGFVDVKSSFTSPATVEVVCFFCHNHDLLLRSRAVRQKIGGHAFASEQRENHYVSGVKLCSTPS